MLRYGCVMAQVRSQIVGLPFGERPPVLILCLFVMSRASLGFANLNETGEVQIREAAKPEELASHNPDGVLVWKGVVSVV